MSTLIEDAEEGGEVMKGVVSGWGTMVCANVWIADGDTFIGLAFLALAIAIFITEPRHD